MKAKAVPDPGRIQPRQRFRRNDRVVEVVSAPAGQATARARFRVRDVETGRSWWTTRGTLARYWTLVPPVDKEAIADVPDQTT